MDFDSLKVTAKINSGTYEGRSFETAKPAVSNTTSKNVEFNPVSMPDSFDGAMNGEANNSYTDEEYINKLSNAIDIANQSLKAMMIRKEFSYRIHEETNRVIVDVKNSDTGEVIKEIPSEENLDMIAKMQELAGIFIDEKR